MIERVPDRALVAGAAHRRDQARLAAALVPLAHQVKDAVDDPPGQVATQRRPQQRVHPFPSRNDVVPDQQRHGQDHQQAAEDLDGPIDGTEHATQNRMVRRAALADHPGKMVALSGDR